MGNVELTITAIYDQTHRILEAKGRSQWPE